MNFTKDKIEELITLIEQINSPEFKDKAEHYKNDNEISNHLASLKNVIDKYYVSKSLSEEKINEFNETLLKYAEHNFTVQNEINHDDDLFDSLALSINILGEELNYSTVSNDYIENIFNSMEDMLIVIDENGIISSVNNATSKKLKYEKEELINCDRSIILPASINLNKINYSGKINPDHYLLTKDGERIQILLNVSPFVRGDGNVTGQVIIAHDISIILKHQNDLEKNNAALIKAKTDAEEANRLKSAFLANLSHEIRTPLNSISGFAEILLIRPNMELEKQHDYYRSIRRRSKDLLSIINDILDISRIEAHQMGIFEREENITFYLNQLYDSFLDDNLKYCKPSIGLRLENSLTGNQDDVMIDIERTKQILENLLINSFKFTENGYVEYGCSLKDPNSLLFYVSDTGIGIPEDKRNSLFRPFAQTNSELSRKSEGTGLGLSICKGILDLMGGHIWIESKEGVGTTFYFTLPYKKAFKNNETINNIQMEKKYNWDNKLILLVEDNEDNAEYMFEVFATEGIRFIYADDGETALKLYRENKDKLDLIFMDVRLPDITGWEVTRIIRSEDPNIIIIAQTAYAGRENQIKSTGVGCNDYISKPIKYDDILRILDKHLNKK